MNRKICRKYLVVVRTKETNKEKINGIIEAIKENGVEVTELKAGIFERAFKLEGERDVLEDALRQGELLWRNEFCRGLLPVPEGLETYFC